MKALVLNAERKTADVRDISSPIPASIYIIVRVEAISSNPIDPFYVAHPLMSSDRTFRSGFAGSIEALGTEVPSANIPRKSSS